MPRLLEALRSRAAFLILVLLGLAVIWLPARPPMVDLPQHAGQLALMRDLMLGHSKWSGLVSINLATPYLLAYFLAAPLTLVMSPLAAMKVVLSAAFVAFFALCRLIRRELGAAAELDAFAAIPFFGFAYSWGLYTYLVAAPVGLAFIWLAIRYSRSGGVRHGLALAALAVVMLFSHGLVFLFACAIGAALILVNAGNVFRAAWRAWPFALAGVIGVALVLAMQTREAAIAGDLNRGVVMAPIPVRMTMLVYGGLDAPAAYWPAAAFAVLIGLPLLGGLRIDRRRREALTIAACVAVMLLFTPSVAWSTSLLYERLVLFMLPAYAWLYTRPEQATPGIPGPYLALAASIVAAGVLVKHAADGVAFAAEAKDFDAVMAKAEPGQRALMLIFDPTSKVAVNGASYVHFPLWYEAEKQGFVDFNFAFYHPELVRFSAATTPPIREDLAWAPERLDWSRDQAWRYRYFFVRHAAPLPPGLFKDAPAPPMLMAHQGEWDLYESRPAQPVAP